MKSERGRVWTHNMTKCMQEITLVSCEQLLNAAASRWSGMSEMLPSVAVSHRAARSEQYPRVSVPAARCSEDG